MRILYKQAETDSELKFIGVENCYLKHLCSNADSKTTLCKEHHHTEFEIHFMNKGQQKYNVDKKSYVLSDGYCLIIPPLKKHCVADAQFYDSKFSITFSSASPSPFSFLKDIIFCKPSERFINNLNNILKESKTASVFSERIISDCIFEMLVILLRMCGYSEEKVCAEQVCDDYRLEIAKQYIKDNIEFKITVSDVAAYCSLGTKQLTRLFDKYENITPLRYIHKQRMKHIDSLLMDGYTLKDISEKMNFSSEYYFNSFYKRSAGISPGKFKKAHTK